MKQSIAIALLALSAACSHMKVPPELKSSPLAIEEKPGLFSGNLRFGPFRAMEISKGWEHGGSTNWFGVHTSTSTSQDFSFRYEEEGQAPREVACHAAFEGSSTRIGHFSTSDGQESLECKFGQRGAPAPEGILRLTDAAPGRLELGETVLEVQANSSFENGASTNAPLGYVLVMKGEPIAAVDRNLTAAWLKRDLAPSERTAAGLGSTIMLLYRPQQPSR